MEANHTPGPWHVQGDLICDASRDTYTNSKVICSVDSMQHPPKRYVEHAQTKANARLIAAAPDLLEALEACITDDNAHCLQHQETPAAMARRLMVINDIARAAIAKARNGEVPPCQD